MPSAGPRGDVAKPLPAWEGAWAIPQEVLDKVAKDAQEQLDTELSRRKQEHAGFVIAGLLHEGDPRSCIAQAAAEIHADLIVLGTHGRRGFARALLGSVAEAVARVAPCPVLLVRAPEPTATAR